MPGIARYEDKTVVDWFKYERIKVLQDEYGRATQAHFAVIDVLKKLDKGSDNHSSKHICIPLTVGRLLTLLDDGPIKADTKTIRLKIAAEPGFNPHTNIDVDSLRLGSPEEVNFGRGCRVRSTQQAGDDLIVTFDGSGNGITKDNFAAKLLGKTSGGKLLFGYARLPWLDYAPPALSASPPDSRKKRPNVVIFYADDVGQGDISAYGFAETTKVATPNIDALAARGMRFTNAHTVYALCAPSRYGILSGNLALRGRSFNGTWQAHHRSQFLDGQKTLGNLFQEAGYRTAFFGKTHLGGQFHLPDGSVLSEDDWTPDLTVVDWLRGFHRGPTSLGFDYSFLSHDGIQAPPYIYFENDRPVDRFSYDRAAKRWRWSAAAKQPYVYLQTANPRQAGYIAVDSDADQILSSVELDTGKKTVLGYADWDSTKTGEIYAQAALDFIDRQVANHPDQPFYMHYCSQCVHVPHTPDTFFGQAVRGTQLTRHLDLLHEMDLQFKALIDKLEEKGVADNTIIIFTSDNGGLNASAKVGHDPSGPFRGSKRFRA